MNISQKSISELRNMMKEMQSVAEEQKKLIPKGSKEYQMVLKAEELAKNGDTKGINELLKELNENKDANSNETSGE